LKCDELWGYAMKSSLSEFRCFSVCATVTCIFLITVADVSAKVLYQDSFTYEPSPTKLPLPAPWKSVWGNQWLEDGWLHNQDQDGGARDSQAILHDSDSSWDNYSFHATAEILGPNWTYATFDLRTQGYSRSSDGTTGRAYELTFLNTTGPGQIYYGNINRVALTRVDCTSGPCTYSELANKSLPLGSKGPFEVDVKLNGGDIRVFVDGSRVIHAVDANPITFGGVGIHNIWESHARYDDVLVASIPEPQTYALMLAGLGMLGLAVRRTGGLKA
jgi:hypothetical protein